MDLVGMQCMRPKGADVWPHSIVKILQSTEMRLAGNENDYWYGESISKVTPEEDTQTRQLQGEKIRCTHSIRKQL